MKAKQEKKIKTIPACQNRLDPRYGQHEIEYWGLRSTLWPVSVRVRPDGGSGPSAP